MLRGWVGSYALVTPRREGEDGDATSTMSAISSFMFCEVTNVSSAGRPSGYSSKQGPVRAQTLVGCWWWLSRIELANDQSRAGTSTSA